MTTRKITVSLPAELVATAEAAVAAGQARSVSAYLAQAAGAAEVRARSINDVLAAWEGQHDTPTPGRARVAQEWAEAFMARNDARYAERQAARAGDAA